jgi:hypothetical protein
MADWRVVNSLLTLRAQLDAAYPGRSKASDGTIGDANHTTGDHVPRLYPVLGAVPVVCAFDGTHDPARGCDNHAITEAIRLSRDPRVKYVIWDHRMFSSYPSGAYPPYTWRPYTGTSNPHDKHFHVSVLATAAADSTTPWQIGADIMAFLDDPDARKLAWRVDALTYGVDTVRDGTGEAMWLVQQMKAVLAELVGLRAQGAALTTVVEQLAAAINAGGGSVDTAAILAGVDHRLGALRSALTEETRDAVADLGEGGAAQVRAATG